MIDALKRFFSRLGGESRGVYIEVKAPTEKREKALTFYITELRKFGDTRFIIQKIRQDNIILINYNPIASRNKAELKRAIDKIKSVVEVRGGRILGIVDGFLLVVPSFVEVLKESPP